MEDEQNGLQIDVLNLIFNLQLSTINDGVETNGTTNLEDKSLALGNLQDALAR